MMSKVGKKFKVIRVSPASHDEDLPDHGFSVGDIIECIVDDGTGRLLYTGKLSVIAEGMLVEDEELGTEVEMWVYSCDLEEIDE